MDRPVTPMRNSSLDRSIDAISGNVVDAAVKIHRALGPGYLERVYRKCLAYELRSRGFQVEEEVRFSLIYEGEDVGVAMRADIIVNGAVVIETKTVQELQPVHFAQVLGYLRAGRFPLGLLINFHETLVRDGIERIVLSDAPSTVARLYRTQGV